MKTTKDTEAKRAFLRRAGFQFPGDYTLAQIREERDKAQSDLDRETLAKILPRLSRLFKEIQQRFPKVTKALYGNGGFVLCGKWTQTEDGETYDTDAQDLQNRERMNHPRDFAALAEFLDLSEYLCDDLNLSTSFSEVTATGSKSTLGNLKHD